MFVTPSNFNLLPYNIPNLNLVVNSFQTFADKYEVKVLTELLGVTLYNEFIAGREALPPLWNATTLYVFGEVVSYGVDIWEAASSNVGIEPIEGADWTLLQEGNQWLKLEYGFDFVYSDSCGCHDHTTQWLGITDMLIPYIFYQWTRATFDNNSGIGIVQPKAENSDVIEPKRRLVDAWNDYAGKAHTMQSFVQSENYLDPTVYTNCCSCPPWVEPGYQNTFGL